MDWWHPLVGTALLGTDRQSPNIPSDNSSLKDKPSEDASLATSIRHLDWDHPAQALLGAMGTVAVHAQAGQRPQTKAWKPLPPCPIDDRPCCSATISRYIQRCQGDYAAVLPELLNLIAQKGQRLPEALLPRILDLGARNTTLRPSIVAVLGGTGQWLAAQNRDWDYGTGITINRTDFQSEAVQSIWKEGRRRERVALLSLWRQEDPNGAREALAEVWPSELAKDREALLSVLEPQLSMTDEPFLEQLLDDRAKGVRQRAIALLLQLPDSRLCQRMTQRIKPYLRLHYPNQMPVSLDVMLPDTYNAEWSRDGILELQPNPRQSKHHQTQKQGKRANWLCQLLASTPLNTWISHDDSLSVEDAAALAAPTIDGIMQALKGHPWQDVLLKGWAIATRRQHHSVWANALLQNFTFEALNAIEAHLYPALRSLLSPSQQEELLTQQCPQAINDDFLVWLQQLVHGSPTATHPSWPSWSLNFSYFVWQNMVTWIEANQSSRSRAYQGFSVIKDVGLTLHPAIAPDVSQSLETLTSKSSFNRREKPLADFYSRLNFRHAIHQAFERDE